MSTVCGSWAMRSRLAALSFNVARNCWPSMLIWIFMDSSWTASDGGRGLCGVAAVWLVVEAGGRGVSVGSLLLQAAIIGPVRAARIAAAI
jgi:hypothetical protein